MRKLLLVLAVAGTCLIPAPRTSYAVAPCSDICCRADVNSTSTTTCYSGGWTTCGWYWSSFACR